jgi:hypothetical protein
LPEEDASGSGRTRGPQRCCQRRKEQEGRVIGTQCTAQTACSGVVAGSWPALVNNSPAVIGDVCDTLVRALHIGSGRR